MTAEQEMANFILQLLQTATVRADDQTLGNVMAVKGWLGAIAAGNLVVVQPKPPKATKAAP